TDHPTVAPDPSGSGRHEQTQQVGDALLAHERIGQRQVLDDGVVAAAPAPLARQVTGLDELVDDAVRGALGDPDALADVAQATARVVRDAEEYLRVVAEERPLGHRVEDY